MTTVEKLKERQRILGLKIAAAQKAADDLATTKARPPSTQMSLSEFWSEYTVFIGALVSFKTNKEYARALEAKRALRRKTTAPPQETLPERIEKAKPLPQPAPVAPPNLNVEAVIAETEALLAENGAKESDLRARLEKLKRFSNT